MKVYLPHLPEGTHLGSAASGLGRLSGLVFSDKTNRLVDHAEWTPIDLRLVTGTAAVLGIAAGAVGGEVIPQLYTKVRNAMMTGASGGADHE